MTGPESNREKPQGSPALRSKLADELEQHPVFENVSTDSEKYTRLSVGLKALLLHSLRASDVVEKSLDEQKKLSDSDTGKMSDEDIGKREAYLTEVTSWTVLIPQLLRVTRGIQFQPAVQERMDALSTLLVEQFDAGENMERNRAGIVSRSDFDNAILARFTMRELSYIATYEWLKINAPRPNQRVMEEPGMLREHLVSIGILREQEKDYSKRIVETGKGEETLRKKVDTLRVLQGMERVQQGYPGAEYVLDMPEASLEVWKKLLLQGGQNEKKRSAKQLHQGVRQFQHDFLEERALMEFRKRVQDIVSKAKLENDVAKRKSILDKIIPIIGDDLEERLTTNPEEFDAWYEKTMTKVSQAFSEISSPEHKKICAELDVALEAMEQGKEVDSAVVARLLDSYFGIRARNRSIMSKVMNWQIAETALLPGGRGPQNAVEKKSDQLTRTDGQSGIERVRRLAPYGAFQTRGYTTSEGRFVLLPPAGGVFNGRSVGSNAVEALKFGAEGAAVGVALYGFIRTTGFLSMIPGSRLVAGPAVSIVLAEGSMAVLKGAAQQETISREVANMNAVLKDLTALQRGEDLRGRKLSPDLVRQFATKAALQMQASMRTILQAAQASVNPLVSEREKAKPDALHDLEAHVYANQLMNAFGFPGYHRLDPNFKIPENRTRLSPEAKTYVDVQQSGTKESARLQLQQLQLSLERAKIDPGQERPRERKSRSQQLIDGDVAPVAAYADAVDELVKTTKSPELRREYEKYEALLREENKREEALSVAGRVFDLQSRLAVVRRDIDHPTALQRMWRSAWGTTVDYVDVAGKTQFEAMKKEARVLADIPMKDVLSLSVYLNASPPSNDQIARWYKGQGLSRAVVERYFGPEGKRNNMTIRFLSEWETIRRFADQYEPKVPAGSEKKKE
ncbi:hypothetical protein EXS65_04870 [Candidatus Peribacteria bacterium]|nr:hypothetical protein [Candidatus Peribacteria bacterium]